MIQVAHCIALTATAGATQNPQETNYNVLNILGCAMEFRIVSMVLTKLTVFVPRINANAVTVSEVQIAMCPINAFRKRSLVMGKLIPGKKQNFAMTKTSKKDAKITKTSNNLQKTKSMCTSITYL